MLLRRSELDKIGGVCMAWLAVTLYGRELILGGQDKPVRNQGTWNVWNDIIELPKGSIKKLIGRELSWSDEPVKLENHERN